MQFEEGKTFDLGITSFSEQEIIDFARAFDPLDFHINREAAAKSPFKRIIASGPHLFTFVHRNEWIPLFGKTVIAGLELNKWKFLKPLYPDQKIHSTVTILSVKPNMEKHYTTIIWLYEFKDEKEELLQTAEMTVLHKIS